MGWHMAFAALCSSRSSEIAEGRVPSRKMKRRHPELYSAGRGVTAMSNPFARERHHVDSAYRSHWEVF